MTHGRGLLPQLTKLRVSASQAIGSMVLDNKGDADAQPVWDVRGPGNTFRAVSPVGEVLEWKGTLAEGESVTIDTTRGTCIDNAGNNRYAELAESPRMWAIPPGVHEVQASLQNTSTGRLEPQGTDPMLVNYAANPSFVTASGSPDGTATSGVAGAYGTGGTLIYQSTENPGDRGFSARIKWPTVIATNGYPSETLYPSATIYPSETPETTNPTPAPSASGYPSATLYPSASLHPQAS